MNRRDARDCPKKKESGKPHAPGTWGGRCGEADSALEGSRMGVAKNKMGINVSALKGETCARLGDVDSEGCGGCS